MAKFIVPKEIHHGLGSLENIKNLKGNKAVIVIGGSSVKKNGSLERTQKFLSEASIESSIFEGVEPDPSIDTVLKGAAFFTQEQPDIIIGLGGCSAIDAAKAMWIYYEYPDSKLEELAAPFAVKPLRNKAIFVAIPSTSGTGTEVTGLSVITDREKGTKYPIVSHELTPDVAIIDGELCVSMPKHVTANTGLDVLSHGVEAFASNIADRYNDALAKEAIDLVFKTLLTVLEEPQNLEARQIMHDASCMGGMAFTNVWLGIVHSMSHQLGGTFGIPHGCANAILMPNVVRFNSKVTDKYEILAKMLGKSTAEDFAQDISTLRETAGVVGSLKEYGISKEDWEAKLDTLTENAMKDPCTLFNPRKPKFEEIKAIYQACYNGVAATV
ncbi:iron-containing alcohol dehydrogenase [Tenacibaculum finnmarkense]|uniref:iron-containing alcohol dehydrogenase n=1 Tax=Tenacibaculum finnmarkense TaxID=2781243 RepID=UPI00187B79D5|nr:iron-containing alcohol dehydrogenase [Tenacibaculum finnmarkense]MBE7661126.1 iron-containing alcohol dehydrogenase [Tenacibaculum finnmarkense genomovar finnmarkense]MCG8251468.1 iron-containing alcohol dehydrogenase [Tenacibaculum finnmarkense genomovar finnmarkense]MCG8814948.1 iron-containing alcohol dehydrogenase [Tenacibaculum finnmarkense]MCG8820020.1 iron-containing alcohol dehydrogenase [Tenacibaculum finnmarkense]